MSVKMIELIQEKWREGLAPIVNGIQFADGKICQLESTSPESTENSKPTETKLETLKDKNEIQWAHYMELHFIEIHARGIRLCCGEGSMGGDGYVAAVDIKSNLLIWVAYFDYSNPFINVKLNNDSIVATNNSGDQWYFHIDHPELITVILFDRGS